jgi:hypothetical protein
MQWAGRHLNRHRISTERRAVRSGLEDNLSLSFPTSKDIGIELVRPTMRGGLSWNGSWGDSRNLWDGTSVPVVLPR